MGLSRLCECCKQSQAEVVNNSRNKIHQTWGPPFRRALYYWLIEGKLTPNSENVISGWAPNQPCVSYAATFYPLSRSRCLQLSTKKGPWRGREIFPLARHRSTRCRARKRREEDVLRRFIKIGRLVHRPSHRRPIDNDYRLKLFLKKNFWSFMSKSIFKIVNARVNLPEKSWRYREDEYPAAGWDSWPWFLCGRSRGTSHVSLEPDHCLFLSQSSRLNWISLPTSQLNSRRKWIQGQRKGANS